MQADVHLRPRQEADISGARCGGVTAAPVMAYARSPLALGGHRQSPWLCRAGRLVTSPAFEKPMPPCRWERIKVGWSMRTVVCSWIYVDTRGISAVRP